MNTCPNCHDTHLSPCWDPNKIRVGTQRATNAFQCRNCGHVTPRDQFELVGGVV